MFRDGLRFKEILVEFSILSRQTTTRTGETKADCFFVCLFFVLFAGGWRSLDKINKWTALQWRTGDVLEAGVITDAHRSGHVVEGPADRKLEICLKEGPSLPFKYREVSSFREWEGAQRLSAAGDGDLCPHSAFR